MSHEISEQSRELFQLVVENVEDFAVYAKDLGGRIVSWNPGVERLLGYEEEEWVGQHISIIFTPEDRERQVPEREMETALRLGRAEDRWWLVRKDGSLFWANGLLMLLRDEAGEARGFAKILRNDTARFPGMAAFYQLAQTPVKDMTGKDARRDEKKKKKAAKK